MQVIEKWDGDGRVKPGGKMCREEGGVKEG